MPTTPQVNFNFINQNVQVSVPLNGVSHVIARTTQGPANDPSELITSFTQFQRVFGSEIVPDGSVSNIQKALELGSKLRISRVVGTGAAYGYASSEDTTKEFSVPFTSNVSGEIVNLNFKIRSKQQGAKFDDKYSKLYLKFSIESDGPKSRIILTQAKAEAMGVNDIVDQRVMMAWQPKGSFDAKVFLNFLNSVPNLDFEVVGTFGGQNLDIYGIVAWLTNHSDYVPSEALAGETVYSITCGTDSSTPLAADWVTAYDALTDYNDGYNLICSHIHQHLPTNYIEVYTAIAKKVKAVQDIKLCVEVPKYKSTDTLDTYLSAVKELVNKVGQDQFICYFGGGIKYYDDMGILRDCDVMGTVMGLHDASASSYGPWISPAGQNRGIVADALGPVMPNLGTPSQLENLQRFADWYMNLFVIKDTQYAGKRTMLWQNFTSNPITDSFRFIGTVNLILYLKKNLRPIVESYLEEPNTFSTWKNIFYQVKPILDDLVTRNAMTEPEWLGDQNAQSYSDLQVNKEADVRQGKYHAKLKFKDVVTMQEITLDVIISASDSTIDITTE